MDKNRGLIIATILLFIFGTVHLSSQNPVKKTTKIMRRIKQEMDKNTTKKRRKGKSSIHRTK